MQPTKRWVSLETSPGSSPLISDVAVIGHAQMRRAQLETSKASQVGPGLKYPYLSPVFGCWKSVMKAFDNFDADFTILFIFIHIYIYTYVSLHPRDWKLVKWRVLWNYHFSGRATQQCTDHRIIYIGITFIRSARIKQPVKIQSSPAAVLPAWK